MSSPAQTLASLSRTIITKFASSTAIHVSLRNSRRNSIEAMSEGIAMAPAPVVAPIAPREHEDGSRIEPPEDVTEEPAPITEQEVGEYREQDRYLPVCCYYHGFF